MPDRSNAFADQRQVETAFFTVFVELRRWGLSDNNPQPVHCWHCMNCQPFFSESGRAIEGSK